MGLRDDPGFGLEERRNRSGIVEPELFLVSNEHQLYPGMSPGKILHRPKSCLGNSLLVDGFEVGVVTLSRKKLSKLHRLKGEETYKIMMM